MVFDGRANVFAAKKLSKNAYTFDVTLGEEGAGSERKQRQPRVFTVKMRKVAAISMDLLRSFLDGQLSYTPYEALQVLEVVIRHAPSVTNLVNIGRSFYSPTNTCQLSGPVDAWLGYYQALKPTPGRLLLNIDTSATCFYRPGSLLELLSSVLSGQGGPQPHHRAAPLSQGVGIRIPPSLSEGERSKFEKALKGLRVQTNHNPKLRRKYRVLGISKESADRIRFEGSDGRTLSVADYFSSQYSLRLRHPGLPCVKSGSNERQLYLPLEVCEIAPAQRYMKKLSEEQTADMIKITCQKPHLRLEKCAAGIKEMRLTQNPILDDFSFAISTDFVKADARQLAPPKIFYAKSSRVSEVHPEEGAWNLRDKKMYVGAKLKSWAVLVLSSRIQKGEVEGFICEIVSTACDMGLEVTNRNPPIMSGHPDLPGIERLLRQAYSAGAGDKGGTADLVIVILPTKDTMLYGEIKRITDCIIGRPSQCIVGKNVARPNKQYCANVILKINAKLGGINSTLGNQLPYVSDVPTIVFGADVTHPGPGSSSMRSVASVVASLDIALSR